MGKSWGSALRSGRTIEVKCRVTKSVDRQKPDIQGPFEKPQRRDNNNEPRASGQHDESIKPGAAREVGERQKGGDDGDLPCL